MSTNYKLTQRKNHFDRKGTNWKQFSTVYSIYEDVRSRHNTNNTVQYCESEVPSF